MTYDWEPNQLISDGDGQIIENQYAPLRFKEAQLEQAMDEAGRTRHPADLDYAKRCIEEVKIFQRWVRKQRRAGRPESEWTWGNCVVEMGLLQPLTRH